MGARMLQYANTIAKKNWKTTAEDSVTGELTYEKDTSGNLTCINPDGCDAAKLTLKNFSGNLDLVRELTLFFGFGPNPTAVDSGGSDEKK